MSAEFVAAFEGHFGKDALAEIRKIDVARAEVDAIQLFTELDEKYGSETFLADYAFGRLAKGAIFEMKKLPLAKRPRTSSTKTLTACPSN